MSKAKNSVNITYATATTPAMGAGATDKERMHLSPEEFGAQLKLLGDEVKDLVKMARKVGGLKAGQHIEVGGAKFGAKELNKLVSQHVKTLRQLKKNYTARGMKKKRSSLTKEGKPRKTGDGFSQPSFLEQPLVDFINSANFGPNINAADLAPTLQYGILSRAILTPLITGYMKVNGLRFNEVDPNTGKKKTYFRVNDEIMQFLAPYIEKEEKEDKGLDKSGKPRAKFNRNKFAYSRIQSFLTHGVRDKGDLDENERQYVENDEIKDVLKGIQEKVTKFNKSV